MIPISDTDCKDLLLHHCNELQLHQHDDVQVTFHIHVIKNILTSYNAAEDDLDMLLLDNVVETICSCDNLNAHTIRHIHNSVLSFASVLG